MDTISFDQAWKIAEKIPGWLTRNEGMCLYARSAEAHERGQEVVEVGSFLGRSTVILAATGPVMAIDPWDKMDHREEFYREHAGDGSVFEQFERLAVGSEVGGNITPVKAKDTRCEWNRGPIGLLFVDHEHTYTAVSNSIKHWRKKMADNGVMAFHDYESSVDPDVKRAVDDAGLRIAEQVDSVAVCGLDVKVNPSVKVYIARPTYDGRVEAEGDKQLFTSSFGLDKSQFLVKVTQSSLLGNAFNLAWCDALNSRDLFTHFAMMHDDIVPQSGWLAILIEEMRKHDADVMSAISPIKDLTGDTSTAWGSLKDRRVSNRLKFSEIEKLPLTFGSADHPDDDTVLLVNTGLFVVNIRKDWVERFRGFQIDSWVEKDDQRFWRAGVVSEDWRASFDWHSLGCKVMATQRVHLVHMGKFGFPNRRWLKSS